jgi:hypothetical protein
MQAIHKREAAVIVLMAIAACSDDRAGGYPTSSVSTAGGRASSSDVAAGSEHEKEPSAGGAGSSGVSAAASASAGTSARAGSSGAQGASNAETKAEPPSGASGAGGTTQGTAGAGPSTDMAAGTGMTGAAGSPGTPPSAGPKNGDPNKPIVAIDGLPCGASRSGTQKIGGRDVTVDYPCDKHEGAHVTVILNLHGTLIGGASYLYQHAYFSAHSFVDSHNLIVLTPRSVSEPPSARSGATWTTEKTFLIC